MGIEKKPQMEAEEAFKLDVVRVKLVKEAPLYSDFLYRIPTKQQHYRRASL
jgi:hypothetical protein